MILRSCSKHQIRKFSSFCRSFSSFSHSKHTIAPLNCLKTSHATHSLPPQLSGDSLLTITASSLSRNSVLTISATFVSAIVASIALISRINSHPEERNSNADNGSNSVYDAAENAVSKSSDSIKRVIYHIKRTGVATTVLWQSLLSVLSSANHEVRAGFEFRVAAFLADIAAANAVRRVALVAAGHGAVVDWLLDRVGASADGCGTQAESARALAYLIADSDVSKEVLERPGAVPCLLRFIFSCQPKKKHSRRSSLDACDPLKGRSMLVGAIMDIVTSNRGSLEKETFVPSLSMNAEMGDIADVIKVIVDGSFHMDDHSEKDDDGDNGIGIRGIGIRILEGTAALGFARTTSHSPLENTSTSTVSSSAPSFKKYVLLDKQENLMAHGKLPSAIVPGLWDDLHCQQVAIPFAAWALANWANASEVNRSHIQELDRDGRAVMMTLMTSERSVKWHGSLVAKLLLEDRSLPLNDAVSDWSSGLLTIISQASKNEDISLTQVASSAFLLALERNGDAQKIVMEKGLLLMREAAKRTAKHMQVQEALAKALELLYSGDAHLSLEESQKWAGILLRWVSGNVPSAAIRSSATKTLSSMLEDHGPHCIPISQGWLTLILKDVTDCCRAVSVKGNSQPQNDKVKAQVDQSNITFATQATSQLAAAVVNLVGNQLKKNPDSIDSSLLADFLSMEPFAGPFRNLKKDASSNLSVADSAIATLKGIKALTEVCLEDSLCQEKLTDSGILCLLRRFLLCDDYEKLSAIEVYDASRAPGAQGQLSNVESSKTNSSDCSLVRVPPTGHIRRHAARLLTVLSLLQNAQKAILADKAWCHWLKDCADGKISGCSDPKLQSYARATILNVSCGECVDGNSINDKDAEARIGNRSTCLHYNDMIFLINPELPHWKCCGLQNSKCQSSKDGSNSLLGPSMGSGELNVPPLDVVFVHGLRGGPYKTWRISENKVSAKSGLVEKIDGEAGKLGTFWPGEWLSTDFPHARLFSLKYKTNLTQWSGASLPLQEVSSKLLEKLIAAGIGNRPVVFVTHSMGGLVVKQILNRAREENFDALVNNTAGIVFYSCPHFGSKLADVPWRMGLVLRPAPSIGELRSGSPRLAELNDFIHLLHKKGLLQVLSFCETKVTPIVEGYGGWAFRMEVVPIESAYPGFGELVVLESTDHINSCKPISRSDPSYRETLEFLHKLRSRSS